MGIPLKSGDETTAYLVGSYKYDLLNDVLSLLILGNTGSACIVNESGVIIGDRNYQNIIKQQNIYDLYPSSENAEIFNKALSFQTGSALLRLQHVPYYVGYAPIPGTNWTLFVNVPQREYMDSMIISLIVTILLTILLLLLAASVITPLARKISGSLETAAKRLQALSDGNLTEEVIQSDSNDETGILTLALAKMVASLNSYIQNIQSCLEDIYLSCLLLLLHLEFLYCQHLFLLKYLKLNCCV